MGATVNFFGAVVDFIEQLARAAINDAAMVYVVNDGPSAARMIAMDPTSGVLLARLVECGEGLYVNRSFRLKIEPIDSMIIRPLCCMSQTWVTT